MNRRVYNISVNICLNKQFGISAGKEDRMTGVPGFAQSFHKVFHKRETAGKNFPESRKFFPPAGKFFPETRKIFPGSGKNFPNPFLI